MSGLKSPFDYLDSEDLHKIEEWLSHPNPTIDEAVRILGVAESRLNELCLLKHDAERSEEVVATSMEPSFSREPRNILTVFRAFFDFLRGIFASSSSKDGIAIIISRTSGMPLNAIHDALIEAEIINLSALREIEAFRGKADLTAFGEPPILEIRIQLNREAYNIQSHRELMAVLAEVVGAEGSGLLNDEDVLAYFKTQSRG